LFQLGHYWRNRSCNPSGSGSTIRGHSPFTFNLSYYREYDAENRFDGNSTIASGTIRF
jgi:hypothetical protein